MVVVYTCILMCFICKISFTIYTGEIKKKKKNAVILEDPLVLLMLATLITDEFLRS